MKIETNGKNSQHPLYDRYSQLGNLVGFFLFVREFIVLTMTTAAMYSMSINSLDVWERVTLGLAEI